MNQQAMDKPILTSVICISMKKLCCTSLLPLVAPFSLVGLKSKNHSWWEVLQCTMGFHITFQEMEHIFFKLIL